MWNGLLAFTMRRWVVTRRLFPFTVKNTFHPGSSFALFDLTAAVTPNRSSRNPSVCRHVVT